MISLRKDISGSEVSMRIRLILIGFIILIAGAVSVNAAELNGYFESTNRISFSSEPQYLRIEDLLGIKIKSSLYNNTSFFTNMNVRLLSLPDITGTIDLSEYDRYFKYEFRVKEMYVNIMKFPFDFMDVRVGKQRITWGAGDEISPNDFINPYDFQDSWSFKKRLGVYSLKTDLYYKGLTATGVFLPYFIPDLLPDSSNSAMFSQSLFLAPGITIGEMKDTIIMPESFKENLLGGGKVSYSLFDFDFSLYYLYSRARLPWIKKITVTADTLPAVFNVNSTLFYPRIHMTGFSFYGVLGDVGVWGDITAFIPMEDSFVIDLNAIGMGIMDSTNISGNYYLKYLIGADYTFTNDFYVSVQYLRGFENEKGEDNLNNYLFLGSRFPFANGKIEIAPFDAGIEIGDFEDIKDNYGVIYLPSVTFKPYDNLNIKLSSLYAFGSDKTSFGKMKSQNGVQLGISYYF